MSGNVAQYIERKEMNRKLLSVLLLTSLSIMTHNCTASGSSPDAGESLAVKDSRKLFFEEQIELAAVHAWCESEQASSLVTAADIASNNPALRARLDEIFGDPEMQEFMRNQRLMIKDASRFRHSLRTGAERSLYQGRPSTINPGTAWTSFNTRKQAYLQECHQTLAMILERHPGVTATAPDHDGIITVIVADFPTYKVEIALFDWPLSIQGPFYSENRFPLQNIAAPLYAQTMNHFIATEGLRYIDRTDQWLYHLPNTPEMPLNDHHYIVVAHNVSYDKDLEITTLADLAEAQRTGIIACSLYTAQEIENLLVEMTQLITHTGIWVLGPLENAKIALYRDADNHLRAAFMNIRRPALGGSEARRFYRKHTETEQRAAFINHADESLGRLHDVPEEMIGRGNAGMDDFRELLKQAHDKKYSVTTGAATAASGSGSGK